jgi:hypothetical protein
MTEKEKKKDPSNPRKMFEGKLKFKYPLKETIIIIIIINRYKKNGRKKKKETRLANLTYPFSSFLLRLRVSS